MNCPKERAGTIIIDLERVRFESQAIKEAIDFRYYSNAYDDALFEQLASGEKNG